MSLLREICNLASATVVKSPSLNRLLARRRRYLWRVVEGALATRPDCLWQAYRRKVILIFRQADPGTTLQSESLFSLLCRFRGLARAGRQEGRLKGVPSSESKFGKRSNCRQTAIRVGHIRG